MDNTKCEICGGSFIINTDSGLGVCDSCGNTNEIDRETVEKYKSLIKTADIKMKYNSVPYYTQAIEILDDIIFVDGAKEKIELCQNRMSEIKNEQLIKEEQKEEENSTKTKIGIFIVIFIIALLILFVAGIIFVILKIAKGEMPSGVTYALIGIAVIAVIGYALGKSKGN